MSFSINRMEQKVKTSGGEDLFDTALLLTLRDELHEMKTQTDQRLAEVENTVKALADDVKKLVVLRTVETNSGDAPPKSSPAPQPPEASASDSPPDEEDGSNWNYAIARRGGYNALLLQTVRDLLEMKDAVQFLSFLAQKRDYDVGQQFQQLQAEYRKLQGNQLQEHFRELWKSHYTLLKHKQVRTWKEEVFLTAFDEFIEWLQT